LTVWARAHVAVAETQSQRLPIITFEVGPFAQWKPNPEQIREAEIALRIVFDEAAIKLGGSPLKPKDLSSYGRQYFGKMKDTLRIIEVIGFCRTLDESHAQLSQTPLVVLDGGTCFFRGEYDPEKKVFNSFYFHGDA